MSSCIILVCHDCRACIDSSCTYPTSLGRAGIFTIPIQDMPDILLNEEDTLWIKKHKNHDVCVCSDAYGIYRTGDYNFDTRSFSNYDPYA